MNTDKILEQINTNTRAVFIPYTGFNAITDKLLIELKVRKLDLLRMFNLMAHHSKAKVGNFGWTSNFSFTMLIISARLKVG